jgi:hypothetical protein
MLNSFFLAFENDEANSWDIKHIQYNVYKRLKKLKYVTYRRIDINFVDAVEDGNKIERGDNKIIVLKSFVDPVYSRKSKERDSIAYIYRCLFNTLEFLWTNHNWNVKDLQQMLSVIEATEYTANLTIGKILPSPDKKHKVELLCELYPGYCDYNLLFLDKKGVILHKILFLHGMGDPGMVFIFYYNRLWRDNEYFLISNDTKEIFYVFNVQSAEFTLEFRPLKNTLEACKNAAASYQADISSEERSRLWKLDPL